MSRRPCRLDAPWVSKRSNPCRRRNASLCSASARFARGSHPPTLSEAAGFPPSARCSLLLLVARCSLLLLLTAQARCAASRARHPQSKRSLTNTLRRVPAAAFAGVSGHVLALRAVALPRRPRNGRSRRLRRATPPTHPPVRMCSLCRKACAGWRLFRRAIPPTHPPTKACSLSRSSKNCRAGWASSLRIAEGRGS